MSMLFYGAGNWGKAALKIYNRKEHHGDILEGFVDREKTGEFCGYSVYPVSEIEKKDIRIVITIADSLIVAEAYNTLKRAGFHDIYRFENRESRCGETGDFIRDECTVCNWGDCVLPKVEMHIMDSCNLNCKGCTHFSPLFEKKQPDFETVIRDVRMLKEKIPHIVIFSILGGEPFLNPQIDRYVAEIRKMLPDTYIQIVTNGLLIPRLSAGILECIRENKIVVQISEYKPTHQMIDRITDTLDQYGITYYIQPYQEKQKFVKPLSLSEASRYPHACISERCVNIWNGRITRCPTLMYIRQFNQVFEQSLPEEGALQLSDCPKGFDLLDALQKEVPLCRHCVLCETEWEQCGVHPSVTDFATAE